jgi:hypothetical protein
VHAHKQPDKARNVGRVQRPEPHASRLMVGDRSPAAMRALNDAAGNGAVARTIENQRHAAPTHPLPAVQRVPAAAPAAAVDPEVQHIHDFVTQTLTAADRLIREAKSFRWPFRSAPAKQQHCDQLGSTLDTAEHMIYRQFRSDPAGKEDNPRNAALKKLLDDIQKRHISYVEICGTTGCARTRQMSTPTTPRPSASCRPRGRRWSPGRGSRRRRSRAPSARTATPPR